MPTLYPSGMVPFSTTDPEQTYVAGTSGPVLSLAFAASDVAHFPLPTEGATTTIDVVVHWHSADAETTGNIQWGAAVMARTPGDAASVLTDAYAAETAPTAVAVNSTASGETSTSITIGAADGLADGDTAWIKIRRVGGTMTGDANLTMIVVTYS